MSLRKILPYASLLAAEESQQSLAILGLWQHSSSLCLCLHVAIFCFHVSKFPSYYKDTSPWMEAHPDDITLARMIKSAEIMFPNKVIFTGTGS